jgi:putative oxidoreductase
MAHRLSAHAPQALAVLRIVTAVLFVASGIFHVFHWPSSDMMPPLPPEMVTLMFIAGVLELIGGLLLLAGAFTRTTAFILCGMMAVAYWGFHAPMGWSPMINFGVPAILYCFIFFYLVFAGPGAWALDNLRSHTGAYAAVA